MNELYPVKVLYTTHFYTDITQIYTTNIPITQIHTDDIILIDTQHCTTPLYKTYRFTDIGTIVRLDIIYLLFLSQLSLLRIRLVSQRLILALILPNRNENSV